MTHECLSYSGACAMIQHMNEGWGYEILAGTRLGNVLSVVSIVDSVLRLLTEG